MTFIDTSQRERRKRRGRVGDGDQPAVLTITYTGQPVRLDRRRINQELFVANVGQEGVLYADDRPGEVAARLFQLAQQSGALITPAGLDIDCYGDDDQDGGGARERACPGA